MSVLDRREFLAAAVAATTATQALGAAEPHVRFPRKAIERLAVSTYPFRSVIANSRQESDPAAKPGMTLEAFAATIRTHLGVSGIEPWSHHFKSVEPDYVRNLGGAFQKAGLHVVNIPVDVRVNLCGGDDEREQGLAVLHKWVDAALLLGSPSIRVHLPRGEKEDITCAVTSLKSLAAYGESKNVVINVENDNPSSEGPERIVRVLQAVGSHYLRALPDFCNSMIIYNDQAENVKALATLFSLAYNISHAKDAESDGKKVYQVDMAPIFATARKAGYRGFFSMEFEGTGDPYQGTKDLIAASLKNLS